MFKEEIFQVIKTKLTDSLVKELEKARIDEGIEYEVQARGVKNARFSPWTESTLHTVIGKSTPPPDVPILNVVQNEESVVFRWASVTAPDIDGYEIRYGPTNNSTWDNAIKIAEATKSTVSTEADVPPGDFKFFIKAVDTAGNFSRNAAQRVFTVRTLYEGVKETRHDPDWDSGVYQGFVKQGTALQVNTSTFAQYRSQIDDLLFDAENVRAWANLSVGFSNVEESEEYGLVTSTVQEKENYGSVSDSVDNSESFGQLLIGVPVSNPRISYQISSRNDSELWPNDSQKESYGSITQAVTDSINQGSITESVDDADNLDTLMTWADWTKGKLDARYIVQRIKIEPDTSVQGGSLLQSFKSVVDVPEKIEPLQDKAVAVGGTRFDFNKQFHFKPVVTATPESDQDVFAIRKNLDKTGVTFVVRDSNGTDVGTDNLDIIARGY